MADNKIPNTGCESRAQSNVDRTIIPTTAGVRSDPNSQTDAFLARTAVIIPARNECASIELVLSDLPAVGQVIVVDNGSTDGTGQLSAAAGARVVREERPGYGQACLAGLAYLQQSLHEQQSSVDFVAFLDADYSDYPEMLANLVRPIHEDQADFVLGSRLLGKREAGAMPPQSVYGNRLAVFLIWLFWKHRYTDLGPFRVIRVDRLWALEMQDRDFGWTVEMQIKAVLAELRILEIAVPYRRRIGQSKISGTVGGTFQAGFKILTTIAKYAWQLPLGSGQRQDMFSAKRAPAE